MKRTIPRRRRSLRIALAIFAILTVSLLPLRALCDLGVIHAGQTTSTHHDGDGDGEPAFCCATLDDHALVDSVAPDLLRGATATPLFALLAAVLILSTLPSRSLPLLHAPPSSRSYYARSARVLR